MDLKKGLLDICLQNLNLKIDLLQSEYHIYQESIANETKSTAGDKHDTFRSMMQLEQEKMASQLNELLNQKKALINIQNLRGIQVKIGIGSVVFTNHGNFFISVFSKPIEYQNQIFAPISIISPLGKELQGRLQNETFTWNGKSFHITKVVY